jgi:hypothetical protein
MIRLAGIDPRGLNGYKAKAQPQRRLKPNAWKLSKTTLLVSVTLAPHHPG